MKPIAAALFLFLSTLHAAIVDPTRVITWEGNVGIPGGIPTNQTIWAADCTVAIPGTSLKLVGNGTTDNASAFAYIAANCPIGQVAKLGSGVFNSTADVNLGTRGIILRGNGPASTTIKNCSLVMGTGPSTSNTTTLSSSAAKGATSITVASATGFSTGEQITIEGGESSIVNITGYEDSGPGLPAQRFTGTITGVSGTTISFTPALYMATASGASVISYTGASSGTWTTGGGFEDFKLQPDPNDDTSISMTTLYRCWLKNIEIDTPRNHCIYGRRLLQCVITHCYMHDASINGSGGGYGVTFENGCSANLIYDNIAKNMTGAFQVNEGSSGNVFAYNYVPSSDYYDNRWTQPDFQNHSAHPTQNLWEGNYGFMALFDDIHGNSSYNTIFRNRLVGYQNATIQNQQFCIGIEAFNVYCNVIGNVLGSPQMTTYEVNEQSGTFNWATKAIYALNYDGAGRGNFTAGTTLYRHGNWDSVTNSIIWDASNSDHSIPDSMYLSSKPTFFGSLAWPPFDPANPAAASADDIPAGYRYINGADPPTGPPPPIWSIQNLRVTTLTVDPTP